MSLTGLHTAGNFQSTRYANLLGASCTLLIIVFRKFIKRINLIENDALSNGFLTESSKFQSIQCVAVASFLNATGSSELSLRALSNAHGELSFQKGNIRRLTFGAFREYCSRCKFSATVECLNLRQAKHQAKLHGNSVALSSGSIHLPYPPV